MRAPLAASRLTEDRPDANNQLAALAVAVLLIDSDGFVAEANSAAEELFGRSVRHLVGKSLAEFLAPAEVRFAPPSATLTVARDVAVSTGQGLRRVDVSIVPLTVQPAWRVVSLTERSPDRANEAGGGPVRTPAILAHEIKNPLAAIRGAGQLLARRVDTQHQPLLDIIASEVERITSLIDRMQQLGSVTKGDSGACNVHEVARTASAAILAARGGAIEIAEEFDPSLPPVAAGPIALGQVVANLLSNGCDACASQAHPRILIRTRFVGGVSAIRAGAAVRLPVELSVIDNGSGIAPAVREHLFEPFVTGKPYGQGLGLALVRKLIGDMGGRVDYHRDEVAGLTSFRINLAVAAV